MKSFRRGSPRLASAFGFALTASALTACSSPPPPPPQQQQTIVELSAETSAKIDEALDYLNNPNVEERWRNQLVTCGQESDLAKKAVIERTIERVKKSYEAGSRGGLGLLKPPGRRRAYEALDKVGGDEPEVLEILKQGCKESDAEACGAAAAALAARGDEGAFVALLNSLRQAKDDATTQDKASAAAQKLAKPERLPAVLRAVDSGSRKAFTPVVLACLPKEDGPRADGLRVIARADANPDARALALAELSRTNDAEIIPLAQAASGSTDASLRNYGLKLLSERGGGDATAQLGKALDNDPADAGQVASLLARVDSPKTVEEACRILENPARKGATRAAVAREVLSKLRDPASPAAVRADSARDRGLAALRHAIDDSEATVADACVAALGRSGDPSDAEEIALRLSSLQGARAETALRALGQLGGARASEMLIERHGKDASLRNACREALVAMKGLDKLPGDQGLALIRQLGSDDVALRKSALAVLRAVKGDPDVHDFDPEGAEAARKNSIDRWRKWWREKLVARGG